MPTGRMNAPSRNCRTMRLSLPAAPHGEAGTSGSSPHIGCDRCSCNMGYHAAVMCVRERPAGTAGRRRWERGRMGLRISVDTGGTFTDVVVVDETGQFHIGKALTTPERIFGGMQG